MEGTVKLRTHCALLLIKTVDNILHFMLIISETVNTGHQCLASFVFYILVSHICLSIWVIAISFTSWKWIHFIITKLQHLILECYFLILCAPNSYQDAIAEMTWPHVRIQGLCSWYFAYLKLSNALKEILLHLLTCGGIEWKR